jgi:hypothetical protein
MAAQRICGCGAEVHAFGDALICVGCGARARVWRVLLDGRAVGAGVAPAQAGARGEASVALAPEFEAALLELRDGPSEPIRYAIPSSWRRVGRRRQQVRR